MATLAKPQHLRRNTKPQVSSPTVSQHGSKLFQLSKHLIKECGASLGPVQHEIAIIGLICNLVHQEMAWTKKWENANFLSSIIPTQNDLGEFLDIFEILQCAI